jgi:thiomorpholine-carboxylate dehydrogenase
VLAVLGSGVQARSHVAALRCVRQLDEVRIWSCTLGTAEKLAQEVGARATNTAEEAVRGADVVVTVTSSGETVLRGGWLKPGAHVNAVGAVGPNRRELDDEAMDALVVAESREAAEAESFDIRLSRARVEAELGELLAGKNLPRQANRTVFKSVGMAVEDVAAAKLVYDAVNNRR